MAIGLNSIAKFGDWGNSRTDFTNFASKLNSLILLELLTYLTSSSAARKGIVQ